MKTSQSLCGVWILMIGSFATAQLSPSPIPTASPPSFFIPTPTPTPIPNQTPPPPMEGFGYPLPPNPWVVQPGQEPQPQPLPPGAPTPSTNPEDFGYPLPPNPWVVQPDSNVVPETRFPDADIPQDDFFDDQNMLPPTEPSDPVYPDDMQSPFSSPFENQTFPPYPENRGQQQQSPPPLPPSGSMQNRGGANATRQPQSTSAVQPTPAATPIHLKVLPADPARKKTSQTASTRNKSVVSVSTKKRAPASIESEPWTDRREFHVTFNEPVPTLIREAGSLIKTADARIDAMEEAAESNSMDDRALLYQATGFISAHRQRLTGSLAALKSDRDSTNKKGILVEAMNETRNALRRFDDGVSVKDFR